MQGIDGHDSSDSSSDSSNLCSSPLEDSLWACLNISWQEPSLDDEASNKFNDGSQE